MSYDFSKLSILIVEDNQPMANITRDILYAFGVKAVDTAENGETGFKKFREKNYDILIIDWMMKPLNGIDLTRKIRHDEYSPNRFVPIILMTGISEKKKVMEARDSGVTEFLVKPFTADDLYKRLVQVIERPRQFVKCDAFFGPDRRRRSDPTYNGTEKRNPSKDKG